ncbi:MAG: alpha/beta hydrolase [Halanaerobiales bacterium]
MFKKRKIIIIIIGIILLIVFGSLIYLNQSYSPLEGNHEYLAKENIYEDDQYYHFKSEANNKTGLIFYQGAKVEEESYAPLCKSLNQADFPVFLVKMPFNLAVFDKNRATQIIKENNTKVDNWYIIGHSLGGAMAASYLAEKDVDYYTGIIFLASYPPEDIDFSNKNIKVLSISATEDQIMNREKFTEAKNNLPEETKFHMIEGGNHAGFGNYGPQQGDGKRNITREKQWEITNDLIINFIKENE